MPKKKGAHLGFDDRCEIEDMLKEGASFREIARKLEVSPTTVSNEVRLNRVLFKPKAIRRRPRQGVRSTAAAPRSRSAPCAPPAPQPASAAA